ncbi:MAG: Bug family tripartite tricarboxylate transporter substrate binding protein, partial [Burkholderiales bacterium]
MFAYFTTRGALALGLLLYTTICAAQFPTKAIRIIMPTVPGTAVGTLARTVADGLTSAWGQPVVVEAMPGASGIIAAQTLAKSAPDGYTMMVTQASLLSYNQSLFAKLPYDPIKDFAPISLLAAVDIWLLTQPAVPAVTFKEFVAHAKSQPGKLAFSATGGTSGLPYIAAVLVRDRAGMDLTFVPYKAQDQAITDMLGGRLHLFFDAVPSSIQQVRAGRLRPLAVLSPQRMAQMPEVPTITEVGIPEAVGVAWNGMVTRAGVPMEVINRTHREVVSIMRSPAVTERLSKLSFNIIASTPEQFAEIIQSD